MSRPVGSKNKVEEIAPKVAPIIAKVKVEEPINVQAKEETKTKPVLEPLQPGQKYFETPDGRLIIGEADKQQVWDRQLNHGRGGWVNPKR